MQFSARWLVWLKGEGLRAPSLVKMPGERAEEHAARAPKYFWSSESLQLGAKVRMLLLGGCVGGRGGEPT